MASKNEKRPSEVIQSRLTRCRKEMKRHDMEAYLITNREDGFYLIGFTGEDSAVLITRRAVHVISDARFDETINQECPWTKKWLRKGTLIDEIGVVCRALKLGSVAVQTNHITVADHATLKKRCRPTRCVAASPILTGMRRTKDSSELAVLRKAIRIAEDAFDALRAEIRVGQTEEQMAARLEYEMRLRGASRASFPTICAEGANAALPHAHPGKRKVKKGSAILFDWGAKVGWYCSDLTRMVFVGSIPPRIRKVYGIVLEAQMRAIDAIRPGERMCDIDAVARDWITKAGFGKEFGHGLGHGLGIDVHEEPRLSWRSKELLAAGDVVTVEPGVYLPGVGGVRIEDDVLVTERGCRVLSRISKTLEDAII